MSANPQIVIGAMTGYVYDSNTIVLMCLYENKALLGYTRGMVKLRGGKHDTDENVCYQDVTPGDWDIQCAPTTAYNLKNLGSPIVSGYGIFDFGCLESFGCSAGDNCDGLVCTTWGPRISNVYRIPIRQKNTAYPLAPTGLIITPGNGALTLVWNLVNDSTGGEVFAYNVKVFDGTIPIIDGYAEAGLRNITIRSLTNGKNYSILIYALNHNGYTSFSAAMGSGTPVQGSVGSINFVSNPTGAEIFLDNSGQKHITPYTITSVPVGTHSYRLTLADHTDITGNVTVQSNKIAQVSADFTTTGQGSINFVSNPIGAEIFLDNSDQQHITPYTITSVPVGTHSYRLTLADHTDITGNVTVQSNKIAQVSADFTTTTGQVGVGALIVLGVSVVLIGGIIYYVTRKPETTVITRG